MLFWAVDNAAPANYLLISGDRDFSNALHQLRMRRYNILLAQPQKASAPLIAAAKSVWLWTSLLAGGPPLTDSELQRLSDNSNPSSDTSLVPVSDASKMNQTMDSFSENPHLGNQKPPNAGRGADIKCKGKQNRRNWNQSNIPRTASAPQQLSGAHNPNNSHNGPIPKGSNGHNLHSNYQNSYSQQLRPNFPLQPTFGPSNSFSPDPHTPASFVPPRLDGPGFTSGPTNVPDVCVLNISEYPNRVPNPPSLQDKPSLCHDPQNNQYHHGLELPPSSSSAMGTTNVPSNGIWGSCGFQKPSKYVQGLIGVILLTLNTLKNEKILPTEANITDCIRYGDPKHQNTDVKKALGSAIEQQMVITKKLGKVQLYVGKNDKLWKCVNLMGGYPKLYPEATWDELQNFLISPAGRSAIMASQCK